MEDPTYRRVHTRGDHPLAPDSADVEWSPDGEVWVYAYYGKWVLPIRGFLRGQNWVSDAMDFAVAVMFCQEWFKTGKEPTLSSEYGGSNACH